MKFNTYFYGTYLVVLSDGIEIQFEEQKTTDIFVPSCCCIFDNNINDFYAKCCSMELVKPGDSLKINARGKTEFSIIDNNGNELRFCGV